MVRESKILVITKIEDFRTTALGSPSGARCAGCDSLAFARCAREDTAREVLASAVFVEHRESEIPEPTAPAVDGRPLPTPPTCQFSQLPCLGREHSRHGRDRKGQVAQSIPGDGERERSERERRKPSVARLSEQARDRRERAQRAPDGEPSAIVRKSSIFVITRIFDSRTTRRTELSDLGLSLHKPAV